MSQEFCFLKDQELLSDEEYAIALNVCDYIRRVIAERPEYIRRNALDPDVYFPMANWSLDNAFYDGYRQLVAGDRQIVAHLRLFSQMFTGYRLVDLKDARGTHVPNGIPENVDEYLARSVDFPDPWVARYKAVTNQLPIIFKVGPPPKFGEIGWKVDGRIVTRDTYVYVERLALLYEAGLLNQNHSLSMMEKTPLTILEIGGGFGGLAYHLKRILPQARYYVLDLPESLIFSAIYLSVLFPKERCHLLDLSLSDSVLKDCSPGFSFLPNFLFPRLVKSGLRIDLVINTLSMSEMSESQVRAYCEGIHQLLGTTGVFFEQNQDNRAVNLLNASDIVGQYFSGCVNLSGEACLGLTQGAVHLWMY